VSPKPWWERRLPSSLLRAPARVSGCGNSLTSAVPVLRPSSLRCARVYLKCSSACGRGSMSASRSLPCRSIRSVWSRSSRSFCSGSMWMRNSTGCAVTLMRSVVRQRNGTGGRRLDFLMQELNREANTLSSKSQDLETTRAAVEMKVIIEQMREQVQNVE